MPRTASGLRASRPRRNPSTSGSVSHNHTNESGNNTFFSAAVIGIPVCLAFGIYTYNKYVRRSRSNQHNKASSRSSAYYYQLPNTQSHSVDYSNMPNGNTYVTPKSIAVMQSATESALLTSDETAAIITQFMETTCTHANCVVSSIKYLGSSYDFDSYQIACNYRIGADNSSNDSNDDDNDDNDNNNITKGNSNFSGSASDSDISNNIGSSIDSTSNATVSATENGNINNNNNINKSGQFAFNVDTTNANGNNINANGEGSSNNGTDITINESIIFRFPRTMNALIKLQIEYNLLPQLGMYFENNEVNLLVPCYNEYFSQLPSLSEIADINTSTSTDEDQYIKVDQTRSGSGSRTITTTATANGGTPENNTVFINNLLGKYFGGYSMLQGKQLSKIDNAVKYEIFNNNIAKFATFLSHLHQFDTSNILKSMYKHTDCEYNNFINIATNQPKKLFLFDKSTNNNGIKKSMSINSVKNIKSTKRARSSKSSTNMVVPVWTAYHELVTLIEELKWLDNEHYFENTIDKEIVTAVIDDCETILLPIWRKYVLEYDFSVDETANKSKQINAQSESTVVTETPQSQSNSSETGETGEVGESSFENKCLLIERGLIHGDLQFNHLLINENKHNRLIGVIDWSNVCVADIALEFRYIWSQSQHLCHKLLHTYKAFMDSHRNDRCFDAFFDLRIEIYGFITLVMMNGFGTMLKWKSTTKDYYKNQTINHLNKFKGNVRIIQQMAKHQMQPSAST